MVEQRVVGPLMRVQFPLVTFNLIMGYRQIGKAAGLDPVIFLGGSSPSTPVLSIKKNFDKIKNF